MFMCDKKPSCHVPSSREKEYRSSNLNQSLFPNIRIIGRVTRESKKYHFIVVIVSSAAALKEATKRLLELPKNNK
jgi:hypothetical protein